ncbi:hypothetical protein NL676_029824 [Syzygium grande]|nr:hypothetical protein NL676_029824 [Syzygium grande]
MVGLARCSARPLARTGHGPMAPWTGYGLRAKEEWRKILSHQGKGQGGLALAAESLAWRYDESDATGDDGGATQQPRNRLWLRRASHAHRRQR